MWSVLERETEHQLAGLGDPRAGEWRERGERAFHIRRRLSDREMILVGPAVDIRGSEEARIRAIRLGLLLTLAPADVLADELDPR